MKKHDFGIIGGALMLAIVCAVAAIVWQAPAGFAHIYVDNELYRTVSLEEDTTVEIKQENGCVNRIEITRYGVQMVYANCPHQDCVKKGRLTAENSRHVVGNNWIVCLPNRVSVEVVWEE